MTWLVTFHSVSAALQAESLVARQAPVSKVVPVPRSVSSSCGYALETADIPADGLVDTLNHAEVEWDVIYRVLTDGKKELYEPVAKADAFHH
ncbi:MAG: DUF3343 domain-containing protein [Planctomycetes bacterium]|nr:DUF3343 domain-containing protein [Planctomycetota bacterium]